MRARCRLFVEMKGLRIEAPRERLDLVGGKEMAAERKAVAELDVLEIVHVTSARAVAACTAAGVRRPNIEVVVRVMTGTRAWLNISNRKFTRPISGRVREALVSSTVARKVSRSPGRTGASHFTSSTPGDPIELELTTKPSAMMRISSAQLCQPDAARPPNIDERAASSSK